MTAPLVPHFSDALVLLDLFGIAVFAISGALLAAERRLDFVTFVFFAAVTGVGGGTLRDLLIGAPVFWVRTNATLLICIGAALGVWFVKPGRLSRKAIDWSDAAGMAAYATYGAAKALGFGVAPVPAFAMGNPDGAPPKHVIDKLCEVANKPNAHRYSASRGIPGLRKAQAAYYQRRFGVMLDPDREVIVTLGSKEGLANLAQAITAPGDVVLAPNPSYPIHTFGFIIAGAAIRSIPAAPGEEFFERLTNAMRYTVPRPKVLVVGYPSNPTAYVADLTFYERLVAFAREHELIVISDLAYAEIYFGDTPTPSILQVEGAKDVAVEFTSMSKTYSMAGWRIGFAVGNERLIEALARVKSYLDYGAFTPVQAAAVAALNGPQDIVESNRALYRKRRDVLVESFGRAGWPMPVPQASMFAWAPIPERFHNLGAMEFSKRLLTEAHVAVAPGVGFGEEGEGFVRIALVENEQRLRQAARGVKKMLSA